MYNKQLIILVSVQYGDYISLSCLYFHSPSARENTSPAREIFPHIAL